MNQFPKVVIEGTDEDTIGWYLGIGKDGVLLVVDKNGNVLDLHHQRVRFLVNQRGDGKCACGGIFVPGSVARQPVEFCWRCGKTQPTASLNANASAEINTKFGDGSLSEQAPPDQSDVYQAIPWAKQYGVRLVQGRSWQGVSWLYVTDHAFYSPLDDQRWLSRTHVRDSEFFGYYKSREDALANPPLSPPLASPLIIHAIKAGDLVGGGIALNSSSV